MLKYLNYIAQPQDFKVDMNKKHSLTIFLAFYAAMHYQVDKAGFIDNFQHAYEQDINKKNKWNIINI